MSKYENELSNLSYTNKDFQQIYPELLDIAKKLSYKWDPTQSDESDPGVVLLKLAALLADKTNYNVDKNALELFPLSVTQLQNARQLFEQCGYYMHYYQSGTTELTLKLVKEPDNSEEKLREMIDASLSDNSDLDAEVNVRNYVIPAFTMFADEENNVIFTTTKDVILRSDNTEEDVPAIQGVVNTYTVGSETNITANMLDPDNRLYFKELDIAENGIFIYQTDLTPETCWEKVDNLLIQPVGKHCYKFGLTHNGSSCYVEFPSDIKNLIGSGLTVKYIRTQGVDGNVKNNIIDRLYTDCKTQRYISLSTEIQEVTLTTSNWDNPDGNLFVTNNLSVTDGKEPETIDEAYRAYERVKGTFDTLVSLKDYENFLCTNKNVSNSVVCDRTNDIESSYKVVSNSELESERICVRRDEKDNPELDAFDLRLYGLHYVENVSDIDSFNKSFDLITSSDSSFSTIIRDTKEIKSIQHNYKDFKLNRILLLYNCYPLSIKVIPHTKLTSEAERKNVIDSIKRNLYKHLNASTMKFGEPVDYSFVYDLILNSSDRIRAITLDDIKYETHAVYLSKRGEDKVEVCTLRIDSESKMPAENTNERYLWETFRKDVFARAVLAGTTPLFNHEDDFKYALHHEEPKRISAYRMTTSTNIVASPVEQESRSTPVVVKQYTEGLEYDLDIEQKFATLIGRGTSLDCDIVVPETFEQEGITYTVKAFGSDLHKNFKDVTSIFIPKTVERIDSFVDSAFLFEITIDKLNSRYEVVNNCLLEKYVDDNGDSRCYLVAGCNNSVIPDDPSITEIKDYAFCNCKWLSNVNIPGSVTCIRKHAFENSGIACLDLTLSSVKNIDSYAFSNCDQLYYVNTGKYVSTIMPHVFSNCTNLSYVTLGSSVTTIDNNAFYNCLNLEVLELSRNIKTVSSTAFDLENNSKLDIPNVVYNGDMSLNDLPIKRKLHTLGSCLFTYKPTEKDYNITITSVSDGNKSLKTLIIPQHITDIYNNTYTVTTISKDAFENCKSTVSNIILPDSITSIGANVFSGLNNIQTLRIPDSVTSLNENSISKNENLETIVLSKNLDSKDVEQLHFDDCTKLTKVYYGGDVNDTLLDHWGKSEHTYKINYEAYKSLQKTDPTDTPSSGLMYKKTDSTVSILGIGECSDINIIIPNTIEGVKVTEICEEAFANNKHIKSVFIPSSITTIGKKAFKNCTNLRKVTFSSNSQVDILDEEVFESTSIFDISIPASVKYIKDYAFNKCTSLDQVLIEEESILEDISVFAFYGCFNLYDIYFMRKTQDEWDNKVLKKAGGVLIISAENDGTGNPGVSYGQNGHPGTIRFGSKGLEYRQTSSESCVLVGRGTCTDSMIVIPSTHNNLYVHGVAAHAFDNDELLEEVTYAPDLQLWYLDHYAFCNCPLLEVVNLPNSLDSLSPVASAVYTDTFVGCPKLSVYFIGSQEEWKSVFKESVPFEPIFSISTSDNLIIKSVTDLESNKVVAKVVDFIDIPGVSTKHFTIPETIETTEDTTHTEDIFVTSVNVPYNKNGLNHCGLYVPRSVIDITSTSLSNFSSIVYSNNSTIKNLPSEGFNNLQKLFVPSSVEEIDSYTFYDSTLENIYFRLGSKLKSIGEGAFAGCTRLKNMYIPRDVQVISSSTFQYAGAETDEFIIQFDESSKLESIGRLAFDSCSKLKTISIPSTVRWIGFSAFSNCSKLKNVDVPATSVLNCIGEYAFNECYSLTTVRLPHALYAIGEGAFYCSSERKTVLLTIYFEGTQEQWLNVHKNQNWIEDERLVSTTYSNYVEEVVYGTENNTQKYEYLTPQLNKGENIIFTAPSLVDDQPYSNYTKYIHNIGQNTGRTTRSNVTENFEIKKDSYYTLQEDEFIIFFWKDEDNDNADYKYIKYAGPSAGDSEIKTFSPSFTMTKQDSSAVVRGVGLDVPYTRLKNLPNSGTITGDLKDFVSDLMGSMFVLTAGSVITTKKVNTIEINNDTNGSNNMAWILNRERLKEDGNYCLFEEDESEYTLKKDEYFIYTNKNNSVLNILQEGTKIHRNPDPEKSICSRNVVDMKELFKEGLDYLNQSKLWTQVTEKISATEMEFYQLGPGNEIKLTKVRNQEDKASVVFQSNGTYKDQETTSGPEKYDLSDFKISYRSSSNSDWVELPARNDAELSWTATSILNLQASMTEYQELSSGQSVEFYDSDGKTSLGSFPKPNSRKRVRLLTDRSSLVTGGTNVVVTATSLDSGEEVPLNVYAYEPSDDEVEDTSNLADSITQYKDIIEGILTAKEDYSTLINLTTGLYILSVRVDSSDATIDVSFEVSSNSKSSDSVPKLYELYNEDPSPINVTKPGVYYYKLSIPDVTDKTNDENENYHFHIKNNSESPVTITVDPITKVTVPKSLTSKDLQTHDIVSYIRDTLTDVEKIETFDYSYKVSESNFIKNPLDAKDLLSKNHPLNKFTICKFIPSHDDKKNEITVRLLDNIK